MEKIEREKERGEEGSATTCHLSVNTKKTFKALQLEVNRKFPPGEKETRLQPLTCAYVNRRVK
jgi:hypothetical protein